MLKIVFLSLIALVISCLAGGSPQAMESDWPKYVQDSMRVPPQATDVRRSVFKGSYQIQYDATACFPARELINATAQAMSARRWNRLTWDPLNPDSKLSFAAEMASKVNDGVWSTYPWKEFWKDKEGNTVYYRFSYDESGPFPETVLKSCSFKGIVIFYPKDVWTLALKTLEKETRR